MLRENYFRITYQVCDFGRALSEPDFSMVNLLGPSLPCKSLKPLTGMRDVPVANCNKRDFCSASQLRMHCRKWLASSKREADKDAYSPKVSDDLILFCVTPVVGVFLPVLDIDVRNSTN